jgi:pilus assembly protein CpaF
MAILSRFSRNSARPQPLEPVAAPSDGTDVVAAPPNPEPTLVVPAEPAGFTDIKMKLHQRLLDEINLSAIEKLSLEEFRDQVGGLVKEILRSEKLQFNQKEQDRIVADVIDEMTGLGPLEPLLKDPTVNDILVNTYARVFVERAGKLELTTVRFKDDRHLLRIINKIVSTVGRRVDESQPMCDARLMDGSRVNVTIPPISVDGPLLSIRKFSKKPLTMESLITYGALTQEMSEVLSGVVRARLNVLISGGTGSGKTTMLNAMSRHIGERERVLTIEDAAELQLQQIHVVRMETRPPSIEGKGEVRQRELVKNALRMRPDRIIVGEVRAGEAFDMLQAMNTGHDGSMSTIHANSCRDALGRLEQMIGMAGLDLPTRSMRQQIASALHVVIQLQRLSDGRRKMVSVMEITGMEGDVIQMQEIFRFQRRRTDPDGTVVGDFRASGVRPKFMEELATRGVTIPSRYFDPDHILG